MGRKKEAGQWRELRQMLAQLQSPEGSNLEYSCGCILPTCVYFRNADACAATENMQCADMPVDTQWFIDRLTERQLSQRKLAKLMDMDPSALSLAFRGKRKLSIDEASQLAVLLGSSLQDVLTAAGAPPSSDRVQIIGYIQGDCSVKLEAEGIHDTVALPRNVPSDTVALQAHTARTNQHPIDGWLYFLSKTHGKPDAAVGSVALCAVKNNGLLLAHVDRGYRAGTYNLLMNTGESKPNTELAWATPVLWIKTTMSN